jgi:hypothetical protein
MGEVHGLTAEQYQAIVAIVDDRLEAARMTREGFERLETAIARLTEAQVRTEARLDQLATAQTRTETTLQQLARQVGGLSETVGGDIEDIAYIVLHDVLQRDFG